MRKLLLFMLGMLLFSAQLLAQNRTISGRITDAQGNGVANASVVIKGSTTGTTTRNDGTYTITVPASARTLTVTSVGYTPQDVTIGSQNTLSVSLTDAQDDLDELVVVAYGNVKRGENTSSSAQINYDQFKNRPITNITAAVEGAAPGLQVSSANGQPGSSQGIRIRGFGSINASSDPLYVVDGVVYSGGLSNFNMEDIASISVLKDAASTALYGSRGANGVVIITTKRGRRNVNQISFKTTQGFSSRALPEYDRVSAFEYYPLMWQALRNSLQYGSGQTPALAATNATANIKTQLGYNPFNVANNDIVRTDGTLNPAAQLLWADDLDWFKGIERTGTRQEYTVNFNGGSDRSDYYASLGYVDEKGFVIRSDQRRILGRINVNAQPTNWFRTGINLSGTVTNANSARDGSSTGYVNPFFFARTMGPIYPVYAHNQTTGAYLLDPLGFRFYDYGNFSALGIPNRPGGASPGRHITAETELNRDLYSRNVLSGRTFGEFLFTKDLKLTTNLAVDYQTQYNSTYDNNLVGDGAPAGRASKSTGITRSYTFNQLLNYTRSFGINNINFLAGHENYDLLLNNSSASRQGQVVTNNYDLDNFTTTNSVASSTDRHRIESYLSRLTYDFDGKYFVNASFRRDGNSRFADTVRWQNFYSGSLGWRVDREGFMTSLPWINALKLRGSYGIVGNDAGIGYYAFRPLYALGFNNALEPGIRQSSLGNYGLTWESQENADVAVEFSLFKNRINGTVEYYHRTSSDLLFDRNLPLSLGGYAITENVATMVNRGWEFQLTGTILRKRDFNWELGINATTLHNEITKMPVNLPELISGTKKLSVGHSIFDYWLRDWQGVDPTDGSALYRAISFVPANSRVRGKDDTVSVSQNNAQYIYTGSAIPDVYGSITNTLNFKGFELNLLMTYQLGGKVYDGTYATLMHAGTYGTNLHKDALRAWTPTNTVTDVPRMDNSRTGIFDVASDRWLIDASYLNIRSLSLGYNIPAAVLSRIKASSARVFVNGENLAWFSARKGMNVQQAFSGVTSNVYVPARVITVGVNLNF